MSLTLRAGALPPPASQQVGQEIAAFSANPVEQLRLAEVRAFRLDGLPGAQASVEIKGAPPYCDWPRSAPADGELRPPQTREGREQRAGASRIAGWSGSAHPLRPCRESRFTNRGRDSFRTS
jgi:hypothetical protein